LAKAIYELVPGFFLGLIMVWAISLIERKRKESSIL
jgi:hypothetical protein